VQPLCQTNRMKNFSSHVQIAWVYTGKEMGASLKRKTIPGFLRPKCG
jgi:hypothetical protein